MKRSFSVGSGLLLGCLCCLAAGPVASVTSPQPFAITGTLIDNPGVNSWPVVVNDDVSTFQGAAVLAFPDGSRISLSPNSRVQLQGSDANPRVVLLAGKMNYNLAHGSHVSVISVASYQEPGSKTGAGQPNDNDRNNRDNGDVPPDTLSRQTKVLRVALPIAFIGLGIAVDAILQPSASPR